MTLRDRAAIRLLLAAVLLAGCWRDAPARPGSPVLDRPTTQGAAPSAGLPDDGDIEAVRRCDPESDGPVECHSPRAEEDQHGRLRCRVGERTCVDGAWSACEYESSYSVGDSTLRAFGDAPAPCMNCDPACFQIADDYSSDPGDLSEHGGGIVWDGTAGGIVMTGAGGAAVSGETAYVALQSSSEVAKIRASDGEQVGRYTVGFPWVARADPSRTAIDGFGDAYVANRSRDTFGGDTQGFDASGEIGTVTKIAGDVSRCVDRNANAVIDTSVTSTPMPPGTDECILWDVPPTPNPGAHLRGLVVDRGDPALAPAGWPWVAGQQNPDGSDEPGRVYQLDPDDGSVLVAVDLPIHPYGAAVDGGVPQRIWFVSRHSGRIAALRLDTLAVEGPFAAPNPGTASDPMLTGYGIAVDGAGKVWIGNAEHDDVNGFDPVTGNWCGVDVGAPTRGVAVRVNPDGSNTVYVARSSNPGRVYSFDPSVSCVSTNVDATYCDEWPDDPGLDRFSRDHGCEDQVTETHAIDVYPAASVTTTTLPAGQDGSWGIGLDGANRVWAVNYGGDGITVLDPELGTTTAYPTTGTLAAPYSYSDFTGYQRAAFSLLGTARFFRDFGVDDPVCSASSTPVWGDLTWSATTSGSYIEFLAQVSNDPDALDVAQQIPLGTSADPEPIFVHDMLPANLRFARMIRITAVLRSIDGTTSPVLSGLGLDWNCIESE